MFNLFRRKPIDPATMAALAASAFVIREALTELETYLAGKGDKRGLAKASRLHRQLDEMLRDNGPVLGVDVVAFSGGGAKPSAV